MDSDGMKEDYITAADPEQISTPRRGNPEQEADELLEDSGDVGYEFLETETELGRDDLQMAFVYRNGVHRDNRDKEFEEEVNKILEENNVVDIDISRGENKYGKIRSINAVIFYQEEG